MARLNQLGRLNLEIVGKILGKEPTTFQQKVLEKYPFTVRVLVSRVNRNQNGV